jgi:hypothetical protein
MAAKKKAKKLKKSRKLASNKSLSAKSEFLFRR